MAWKIYSTTHWASGYNVTAFDTPLHEWSKFFPVSAIPKELEKAPLHEAIFVPSEGANSYL